MNELVCREITVVFARDQSRDSDGNGIDLTGYHFSWPDGREVGLSFAGFCKIGLRYLFGRQLPERATVRLLFYALPSRDTPRPRLPGHRTRVLCLRRAGRKLLLQLPDGTVTAIVFDLDEDDPRVLEWVGAGSIPDGDQQWFGFLALPADDGPGTHQ